MRAIANLGAPTGRDFESFREWVAECLNQIQIASRDDRAMTEAIGPLAPLASPTFTGTVTIPTAVVNGITNGTGLASGAFVPTASALANMDAVTALTGYYLRTGNVVSGSVRCSADATAAGAASFELTPPVASNFNAVTNAIGGARTATSGEHGIVTASVANDTLVINYTAVNLAAAVMTIDFIYAVI